MPRPKGFDPAEKLHDAMLLFWRQGFEKTSIPQLEKHLGINRFSIYDTYGNKHALFTQVLERYTGELVRGLIKPLEDGTRGLDDLQQFLDSFRRRFVADDPIPGCLLCNAAIELGHRDPDIAQRITSYFRRVEDAVAACLLRSKTLGEIRGTPSEIRAYARLFRSSVQGVLVELRLTGDVRHVRPTMDALEKFGRDLQRD